VAITNADFDTLRCAHCGDPFRTYPKPGQKGLPEEIPYVDGGITTLSDEDGSELHYHGYANQRGTCFAQANPELF